jgi:competence protein ComEC
VMQLFPPPESALLAGILLGDDSRMPPELTQAFQDTGTAHIIAISGFNNPLSPISTLLSHQCCQTA